jgi:hypothetical protein
MRVPRPLEERLAAVRPLSRVRVAYDHGLLVRAVVGVYEGIVVGEHSERCVSVAGLDGVRVLVPLSLVTEVW